MDYGERRNIIQNIFVAENINHQVFTCETFWSSTENEVHYKRQLDIV